MNFFHRIPLLAAGLICIGSELGAVPSDHLITDERLFEAQTIRCNYPSGAFANWEPKSSLKETDDPTVGISGSGLPEFLFDSIGEKRARFISNAGSTDVYVVRTAQNLTLVEITPLGSVNTTTIFALKEKAPGGKFLSVTSRHDGFILPLTSQYYGKCKVLEYHQ